MTHRHLVFVTTGDVERIATSKRAFGMAHPFIELGYKVTILLQDTPSNRQRARLEAHRANYEWFGDLGARAEVMEKRKMLRALAPDVVYVGSFGFRNMVSPVRPSGSVFVVEHSELGSAIQNRPRVRRILDAVLEWTSLRAFDGQICASRYLETYMSTKLSTRAGRTVLYSPYAFSRDVLLAPCSSEAAITAEKKIILYMGTLARNYGILEILQAVAQLRQSRDDFRLVVLGSGRDAEMARRYAQELELGDTVNFEGYVAENELPGYLSQADAFVSPLFPTIQDIARCPSKLFMYLPFGKPIVTSKIGEAAELFGEDYDFYCTPGLPSDMAKKLDAALSRSSDWTPDWRADDHDWVARSIALDAWLSAFPRFRDA